MLELYIYENIFGEKSCIYLFARKSQQKIALQGINAQASVYNILIAGDARRESSISFLVSQDSFAIRQQ